MWNMWRNCKKSLFILFQLLLWIMLQICPWKKENINHKKEVIDPFIPFDTKCPEHPKVPINLFCEDDQGKIIIFIFTIF